MNPLTENITKGTFGELLVQLKLLQYGVQAAPPIKDSGNDLIAIRGNVFRAVQVKTRTENIKRFDDLPDLYHILAVVILDPDGSGTDISLEKCKVFLFKRDDVKSGLDYDKKFLICQIRIDDCFEQDCSQ